MTNQITINIQQLLNALPEQAGKQIFNDDFLQRTLYQWMVSETVTIKVIRDFIIPDGVSSLHLSLFSNSPQSVEILLAPSPETLKTGWIFHDEPQDNLLWVPSRPAIRTYNALNHILDTRELKPEQMEKGTAFREELPNDKWTRIEISVIQFQKNSKTFKNELTDRQPVENQRVVRNKWFDYSKIEDTWKYYMNGLVYNTEIPTVKHSWPAQNLSYTLYYYLHFLKEKTGKTIYRILCDFIAYTLPISLPEDLRWRHGIWTQKNEIHCIHQASGILVMLSYYQSTGKSLFLEKSEQACRALLELNDQLSENEIWFLHDSLEMTTEDSKFFYKHHNYSTAFGKSPSNTLCLNTHMWTQVLLYRLFHVTGKKEYLPAIQKSMNALKKVLTVKPSGILYGPVYYLRDFLISLASHTNSRIANEISRRYDDFLRHRLLPLLKRKFPRFIMPNGFTERDIDFCSLSDFYHLANIKDILILYRQSEEIWLKDILQKPLKHITKTSMVKRFSRSRKEATIILDIYLLSAGLIGNEYISKFVEWFTYYYKKETPYTIDILSAPLVCGNPLDIETTGKDVFQFNLPCLVGQKVLLLNLSAQDAEASVNQTDSHLSCCLSSNKRKISLNLTDKKIRMPAQEWMVIGTKK